MDGHDSVLRKSRRARPDWFWKLVCQEPFFTTSQQGRDAIVAATFRATWANPMMFAIRAVAVSTDRTPGSVIIDLFDSHINSPELKSRPQAQWKAAMSSWALRRRKPCLLNVLTCGCGER